MISEDIEMPRTPEEVRHAGIEALAERLGRADMIQFLRQFNTRQGDYPSGRYEWVERISLEKIKKQSEVDA